MAAELAGELRQLQELLSGGGSADNDGNGEGRMAMIGEKARRLLDKLMALSLKEAARAATAGDRSSEVVALAVKLHNQARAVVMAGLRGSLKAVAALSIAWAHSPSPKVGCTVARILCSALFELVELDRFFEVADSLLACLDRLDLSALPRLLGAAELQDLCSLGARTLLFLAEVHLKTDRASAPRARAILVRGQALLPWAAPAVRLLFVEGVYAAGADLLLQRDGQFSDALGFFSLVQQICDETAVPALSEEGGNDDPVNATGEAVKGVAAWSEKARELRVKAVLGQVYCFVELRLFDKALACSNSLEGQSVASGLLYFLKLTVFCQERDWGSAHHYLKLLLSTADLDFDMAREAVLLFCFSAQGGDGSTPDSLEAMFEKLFAHFPGESRQLTLRVTQLRCLAVASNVDASDSSLLLDKARALVAVLQASPSLAGPELAEAKSLLQQQAHAHVSSGNLEAALPWLDLTVALLKTAPVVASKLEVLLRLQRFQEAHELAQAALTGAFAFGLDGQDCPELFLACFKAMVYAVLPAKILGCAQQVAHRASATSTGNGSSALLRLWLGFVQIVDSAADLEPLYRAQMCISLLKELFARLLDHFAENTAEQVFPRDGPSVASLLLLYLQHTFSQLTADGQAGQQLFPPETEVFEFQCGFALFHEELFCFAHRILGVLKEAGLLGEADEIERLGDFFWNLGVLLSKGTASFQTASESLFPPDHEHHQHHDGHQHLSLLQHAAEYFSLSEQLYARLTSCEGIDAEVVAQNRCYCLIVALASSLEDLVQSDSDIAPFLSDCLARVELLSRLTAEHRHLNPAIHYLQAKLKLACLILASGSNGTAQEVAAATAGTAGTDKADPSLVEIEGDILSLSSEDLISCIGLAETCSRCRLGAATLYWLYCKASQVCFKDFQTDEFRVSLIFSRMIELAGNRRQVAQHMNDYLAHLRVRGSDKSHFQLDCIDFICATAYNHGLSLAELGADDLARTFFRLARDFLPYSALSDTPYWKAKILDTAHGLPPPEHFPPRLPQAVLRTELGQSAPPRPLLPPPSSDDTGLLVIERMEYSP